MTSVLSYIQSSIILMLQHFQRCFISPLKLSLLPPHQIGYNLYSKLSIEPSSPQAQLKVHDLVKEYTNLTYDKPRTWNNHLFEYRQVDEVKSMSYVFGFILASIFILVVIKVLSWVGTHRGRDWTVDTESGFNITSLETDPSCEIVDLIVSSTLSEIIEQTLADKIQSPQLTTITGTDGIEYSDEIEEDVRGDKNCVTLLAIGENGFANGVKEVTSEDEMCDYSVAKPLTTITTGDIDQTKNISPFEAFSETTTKKEGQLQRTKKYIPLHLDKVVTEATSTVGGSKTIDSSSSTNSYLRLEGAQQEPLTPDYSIDLQLLGSTVKNPNGVNIAAGVAEFDNSEISQDYSDFATYPLNQHLQLWDPRPLLMNSTSSSLSSSFVPQSGSSSLYLKNSGSKIKSFNFELDIGGRTPSKRLASLSPSMMMRGGSIKEDDEKEDILSDNAEEEKPITDDGLNDISQYTISDGISLLPKGHLSSNGSLHQRYNNKFDFEPPIYAEY